MSEVRNILGTVESIFVSNMSRILDYFDFFLVVRFDQSFIYFLLGYLLLYLVSESRFEFVTEIHFLPQCGCFLKLFQFPNQFRHPLLRSSSLVTLTWNL